MKKIYYCYCPCQQNKKIRPSMKMLVWNTVHCKFYGELLSYVVLHSLCFEGRWKQRQLKDAVYPSSLNKRGKICSQSSSEDWWNAPQPSTGAEAGLLSCGDCLLSSLASKRHLLCSQGSSHNQRYFYITLKYLPSHLTLLQWQKLTQKVSQLDRLSLLPVASLNATIPVVAQHF